MICKIKDQFCLGETVTVCANCREAACDHCSEIIPPESIPVARMCHTCLRRTELGRRLADGHIARLGGVIQMAPKTGWRPFKK